MCLQHFGSLRQSVFHQVMQQVLNCSAPANKRRSESLYGLANRRLCNFIMFTWRLFVDSRKPEWSLNCKCRWNPLFVRTYPRSVSGCNILSETTIGGRTNKKLSTVSFAYSYYRSGLFASWFPERADTCLLFHGDKRLVALWIKYSFQCLHGGQFWSSALLLLVL